MNNTSLIDIIKAFNAKQQIEYRNIDSVVWSPITNPSFCNWDLTRFEFRIAPEKKKFLIRDCHNINHLFIMKDGDISDYSAACDHSRLYQVIEQ